METKEKKFSNKILLCVDCEEEFVFTASAQQYFAEKGFTEDPRRCKTCYLLLKRSRESKERNSGHRGAKHQDRYDRSNSRSRGNGNGNRLEGLPEVPDDFE